MKLLVIGIDAFSSEFFDQHLEDYDTWNWLFDQIENGEAYKETLHSIDEHGTPHTGVEWSSMYTGVMPEKHGITSHGWKKEHLDYSNIQKKTIFERIDEEGLTQAIYSMPVTYPAPQIGNGWSISGFPSPLGTSETYHVGRNAEIPTDLIENFANGQPRNIIQIKDQLPRDDIRSLAPWGQNMTDEELDTVINRAIDIEGDKANRFLRLVDDQEPDVAFFGTHGVDKAGHVEGLEPEGEYTQRIYNMMSHVVQRLLEGIEPENWIIVSDHGFQMNEKQHDRKGVFISSFHHGMQHTADTDNFETRDVAWQIAYQLDLGDAWIGEKRPNSQARGDEEEIKQKLEDMGYL